MRRKLQLALVTLLLFMAVHGYAQQAKSIYYQGVLVDTTGEPLPDGLYTVTFAFYDSASAGEQLWVEEQQLYVEQGEFIAQLGDTNPLTLTFEKPSWLAVTLKGDEHSGERTEFLIPAASLDSE
jgi:hypothetical protein